MIAPVPASKRVRRVIVMVAVAASVFLQGCANYQTRVADGQPVEPQYAGGMMNAYMWGAYVKPEIMSAETCKRGIYDVVVENNYLYSLASVFTLGIWMPLDVSYRCKSPGLQGGGTVPQ